MDPEKEEERLETGKGERENEGKMEGFFNREKGKRKREGERSLMGEGKGWEERKIFDEEKMKGKCVEKGTFLMEER